MFSNSSDDVRAAQADVEERDNDEMIERENRNFVALVCDSVCPDAPYLCKVAFCSVIISRYNDPSFPTTFAQIVMSDPVFCEAFTRDFSGKASDMSLKAYDDALNGFSPCPDALYYSTTETPYLTLIKRRTLFQIGKYIFS